MTRTGKKPLADEMAQQQRTGRSDGWDGYRQLQAIEEKVGIGIILYRYLASCFPNNN